MRIEYEPKFKNSLNSILDYISYDSKYRANCFRDELKTKIEALIFMPYKFKESIYFDNENIRDLVFKGYTIPYKIDQENDLIIIIGINKYKRDL